MPTYEYECSKCELNFDYFQSMNDKPLTTCVHPEGCRHQKSKAKVRRLLGTGAGIIFKGSGFYETDYRSSGYKEAAKKDSESVNAGSNGSESSTKKDSNGKSETASSPKKEKAAASAK